jgi:hypothetical protein
MGLGQIKCQTARGVGGPDLKILLVVAEANAAL